MQPQKQPPSQIVVDALTKYQAGFDSSLIELPEAAVFPHLIPAALATGRKARSTGILLGRQAPHFVRHGRTVRYRLKDVLDWLAQGRTYGSTAEALVAEIDIKTGGQK